MIKILNKLYTIKIKLIFSLYFFKNLLLSFFLKRMSKKFEQESFFLIYLNKYKNFSFDKIFSPVFFTKITNKKNLNFLNSQFSKENLVRMNSQLIYLDCKKVPILFFRNLIDNIYFDIKNVLNSNWKCIQVRAWITKSNSNDLVGPLKFHTDGMPLSTYKIMIYPMPLNERNGSIQFENEEPLNTIAPTALIFKNSSIKHRAFSGTHHDRPVIELTIVRNLTVDKNPIIGDINSVIPVIPF